LESFGEAGKLGVEGFESNEFPGVCLILSELFLEWFVLWQASRDLWELDVYAAHLFLLLTGSNRDLTQFIPIPGSELDL
jgi:hypothetical protein